MKHIAAMLTILLTAFILISCAAGRYPYPTEELAAEGWRSQIQRDPDVWAEKADVWFRAGQPSKSARMNRSADYSQVISKTMIRVPNFQSIKASGDFKIQMVGVNSPDRGNSVYIEGPNMAVRALDVKVVGDVLFIEQVDDPPVDMGRVIVHVCIKRLNNLIHEGGGSVEGIRLLSNGLTVDSKGSGNIFLAGHLNVKCVVARASGSVNIFTTSSSGTEIEALSSGDVNIAARNGISLKSITHHGNSDINIIGSRAGSGVSITADGRGIIGIDGCVVVREVRASGHVCVFVSRSVGGKPCIYVYDEARVGIDGDANELYGYTTRSSRLMARNLFAQNLYVEAAGTSHMNVRGVSKAFALAKDYGSIYYYGNPEVLDYQERNNGTVIIMDPNAIPVPGRHYTKRVAAHRTYNVEPGIEFS